MFAQVRYRLQQTILRSRIVENPGTPISSTGSCVSLYSTSTRIYSGPISRSLRKRINRRARLAAKPVLDKTVFQKCVSQLLPRFTPEDLHNVIIEQDDPLVCFNWASQQHRFRHTVFTYHVTIQKLGAAKMYKEMDDIVNQVLAIPNLGSEPLFNTMIYYFIEDRKLVRAVNIYKHMRASRNLDCRPSIRTYNILFAAFLSRRTNNYINRMYIETIRCLFKQMVDDGVEPDIFCLSAMIKGARSA
ncbi:pentatricopeptide repeat-containing protein At2g27800, mitochondrial-like [Andrographis paniculata]|uniref:pentatricopeptide repeat-containing protein At2g27800, mitochondrial-like n=1 Tax=Andrographis paniculata TaxID=175694 RepID=UPI0021E81E0E|nr:pentatricopeptide repeat-containing protein At2g27800, mitochondrial-like [Andrographis paniculata]XP_051122949.1 pentatricopeptide repeat-containing protein At2g27800, mitochondrial-like [Andrographis paniculata]XP_051123014.1 pentatricopeptide repeat-containing protein At2g27800, mitochondrial-like [Andrographis paniculata]XP_051123082.1 pentatricopeptide repeat-containing protein At2g27800, mitochondrial-like [Andrographis paniculata]XP_051123129.1 pentatricopeptide repeat-containing prot